MHRPQAGIIQLPKISDPRGNLSFIESKHHVPFGIKRVYWIYDVPGGETRGGHAFKEQQEFIISLSGSFDVVIDDGQKHKNNYTQSPLHGITYTARSVGCRNGIFVGSYLFGACIAQVRRERLYTTI